ncbi:hypothetical protein CVT24_007104 [Panaeolus cyanescens]|uniref:Uncharacterized protein n=1 Tax=Panaeolus cyanescens TaxID=181874 RepID=A0A409YP19_9AGAR|nr:hypothetical protein CVT24_007104 [Panaeolus cyanescens]
MMQAPVRIGPADGRPVVIPTSPTYTVSAAGTTVVSAIGPAESGLTKYEIKEIQSRFVVYAPDTTQTIMSEPQTAIHTIEQGAGNIHREYGDAVEIHDVHGGVWNVIGLDLNCVMDDENKSGVCSGLNLIADVTKIVDGAHTVQSTVTKTLSTTFTGTAYPYATLGSSDAGTTNQTPSKATPIGRPSVGMTIILLTVGALVKLIAL